MTKQNTVLRLLQFASPTLPVGSFAYSQGLESAVHDGYITDEAQADGWIRGVLSHNLGKLDLPYLKAILGHASQGNFDEVARLNLQLLSFRETSELRQESLQIGKALRRLLADLELWNQEMPEGDIDWVSAFAYMAAKNELSVKESLLAFTWSWCENQVAAAIKLVPLGQTEGQKILFKLGSDLEAIVDNAVLIDVENASSSTFNLSMLSSQHETQYSRLFRS